MLKDWLRLSEYVSEHPLVGQVFEHFLRSEGTNIHLPCHWACHLRLDNRRSLTRGQCRCLNCVGSHHLLLSQLSPPIKVREQNGVGTFRYRKRVAREWQIKPADAEPTLPPTKHVVRVWQGHGESLAFAWKGPWPMTGAVCPHHTETSNLPQVVQVTQERVGVFVGTRTPGGVRMEAVPLVDQNSLCPFKDERVCVREALEDTHRAERKPPRELDHRLGDVPRSVRIRQESHLLWQNTRFGHNRQPFTKLRLLELLLPLQFLEQKRQVTQVVRVDRQFRKREHVGHRFTDTHTHTAVTSGSTKRFPHPVGRLLKRRNRECTPIDNNSKEWVARDEL